MDSLTYYREFAIRHPRLAVDDERACMRTVEDATRTAVERRRAADRLVHHNIDLALSRALGWCQNTPFLIEEAISAAIEGLFKAARKAEDRGAPFRAFANMKITGELAEMSRRMPVVSKSRHGIAQSKAAARNDAHADVAPSWCQVISISNPDADPVGRREVDSLTDGAQNPQVAVELSLDVDAALAVLPERSRTVLADLYGLNGGGGKTLSAVAQKLKISTERVRQLREQAIVKIRSELAEA